MSMKDRLRCIIAQATEFVAGAIPGAGAGFAVGQYFEIAIVPSVAAGGIVGGIAGALHAFATVDACSPPGGGGGHGYTQTKRRLRPSRRPIIVIILWVAVAVGGVVSFAGARTAMPPAVRVISIAVWMGALIVQVAIGIRAIIDDRKAQSMQRPRAPASS